MQYNTSDDAILLELQAARYNIRESTVYKKISIRAMIEVLGWTTG